MSVTVVSGSFDDLRSQQVRFLEEAAKTGPLYVLLWSDDIAEARAGKAPKFPLAERQYFVEAIRYVDSVSLITEPFAQHTLPAIDGITVGTWVVFEGNDHPAKRDYCTANDITYKVLTADDLSGFPYTPYDAATAGDVKKVIVTGCFDWLHTGHVRFFEETSELGDLYVIAGHDENVRFLKGETHPLFPGEERRYMVQAIRHVKKAMLSSGHGWMDAEPEIDLLKPERYAVNEDGDKPEKRAFCEQHGLEYVVLKRTPKEGLPKRESTQLRGF